MAGFSRNQWNRIETELRHNPKKYGLPIRRNDSVVIGSFNALKLGKSANTEKRWAFLTHFASRFDLLAVQEVMDDLSGIRRLHESLGPSYKLVVSDTTGAFPGDRGLRERLAFLYRPSRIDLKELVSDITYDRSHITATLRKDIKVWSKFFKDLDTENKIRVQNGKKPKTLSKVSHPAFLTFIRTPHCAAFSINGRNGAAPVEFLGVNAHALYGNSKEERNREFFALLDWIVQRAKSPDRMYHRNMILMADLNMFFDNATNKFSDIVKRLHDLNSTLLSGSNAARANFPFLDIHPSMTSLLRTNARKNQTFDHIAFFINKKERGLPTGDDNSAAGEGNSNGYDFGVFDFVKLFSHVIHDNNFESLSATKQKDLLKRTRADVSDHMPIWVRIPIPGV